MTNFYNINKLKYTYLEDNLWIYNTQYYRSFLYSKTNKFPSPNTFIPIQNYANSSYKSVFKAKYAAGLIGKYIYYSLRYIKFCSHFIKFSKRFIHMNKIKKQIKIKKIINYKTNEIIFNKIYKHLILFYREKYRKRIKKYRKLLWNQFYQVPEAFWTNRIKKRIKSFIWKILNLRTFVKNQNSGYNRKFIYWKYRFFFLNYDRIASIIYRWIKKKRLPKKEWNLLRKRKKKKKIPVYSWIDYLIFSIKKKRKQFYYIQTINNNVLSLNTNINNKTFYFENELNSNKQLEQIKNNINLLYNDIALILPILYSNFNNNTSISYKQISNLITFNGKNFIVFFTNYYLFQFFRSINKKKRIIQENNYLKWFYKSLSIISKKKQMNSNSLYIQSGIITKFYEFSKLSFLNIFLKINGWLEKFYIDRDLYYYFVLNRLFSFKKKLKNINILNLVINNKFNLNLLFILKSNYYEQNLEIINYYKNNELNFYNKLITEKDTSWIRLCFYPLIWNYKYLLQDDKEIPISHQIIEKKEKALLRDNFYSTINKTQITMNNFINLKKKTQNLKYKTNLYKKNYKLIYNKIKKPETFAKRMESKLNSNIDNKIKIPFNIKFDNMDQSILNKSIHTFINKKKLNKNWKFVKTNNLFILNKKNKKNISDLQKRKYTINLHKLKSNNVIKTNKSNIFFSLWKKYKIESQFKFSINNLKKYNNEKINYLNDLMGLKNKLIKRDYNKWQQRSVIKYINFNTRINSYLYNYLENKKNNKYLISLWILRKQNRLIFKSKINNESLYQLAYQSRFFEKKGFISTYLFDSNIYKELFLEYSRRLHSKNKLNEFERNFEKIGPLSFYYNNSINISNIKNSIYISSNFIIISFFFKNFYPKPFLGTTQWITKIFINNLFLPFKFLYNNINQTQYNKNILLNKKNQLNFSNYFYKKWIISIKKN